MTDNFIQLGKNDVLRLTIVDSEGKETGEYLEFDLEDIELPLKYQDAMERSKKNRVELQNKLKMIDQRKDVKGKKALSKNTEDKFKALEEFYKKEEEIYNVLLGENGVSKLLNGRKLGWTSLTEIDNIIDKQIMPKLEKNVEYTYDKIEKLYGQVEDGSVLQ